MKNIFKAMGLALVMSGVAASPAMAKPKKAKPAKEQTKPAKEPAKEAAKESNKEEGKEAKASSEHHGYQRGYGMAGCGLGSIVAKEMGWSNGMAQILAATTNGTAYSQTFGITFGTSNCQPSSTSEAMVVEREVFVAVNMEQLSVDAARGDGPYLQAFADILGCRESETDYAVFSQLGQAQHAELFNSTEAKRVAENFITVVRRNEALRANCVRA